MSEQDTPPSGSRWEPTPGQPDVPTPGRAAHPAPPVPQLASETLDSETAPVQPRSPGRGRAATAGAGLALVLGGGLGDHHGFGGQPPQGAPDGEGPGYGPGQDDGGTAGPGGTGSQT